MLSIFNMDLLPCPQCFYLFIKMDCFYSCSLLVLTVLVNVHVPKLYWINCHAVFVEAQVYSMLATVTVLNTTTINWFNESTVLCNTVLITYTVFISDRNWFYFPSFVLQCTRYPFYVFLLTQSEKKMFCKTQHIFKE